MFILINFMIFRRVRKISKSDF